jgi:hypothetical protein
MTDKRLVLGSFIHMCIIRYKRSKFIPLIVYRQHVLWTDLDIITHISMYALAGKSSTSYEKALANSDDANCKCDVSSSRVKVMVKYVNTNTGW